MVKPTPIPGFEHLLECPVHPGQGGPAGWKCPRCPADAPPVRLKTKKPKAAPAGRAAEDALAGALETAGWPVKTYGEWVRDAILSIRTSGVVVREFPWGLALDPPRKYRSDFAAPHLRVLIEVDGGAHAAGRAKVERDTERRGLAGSFGWVVVSVTPAQVKAGTAINLIRQALEVSR